MGIYDRDYERGGNAGSGYGRPPGLHLGGPRTRATNIVFFIFGVYLVQLITQGPEIQPGLHAPGWFTSFFRLYADVWQQPWMGFQLLTYGFLHDQNDLRHILFNMFGLWMFGRTVEGRYGRQEFLLFFLAAIVFSGFVWVNAEWLANGQMVPIPMLGASGGIAAVLILFALNFPNQKIYIWGILGMPAWVFAVLFVGMDLLGSFGYHTDDGARVAFSAHLGGTLFAVLYFYSRWNLGRWLPKQRSLPKLGRPKLRIHDPTNRDAELSQQVDTILKKIQEHGQDSLTGRERRLLEKASREYQRKQK